MSAISKEILHNNYDLYDNDQFSEINPDLEHLVCEIDVAYQSRIPVTVV